MRRIALVTVMAAACGGGGGGPEDSGVDAPISAACQEATTYQDLASIETKILKPQCSAFSGCHNGGATNAGKVDLREGMAFAHLVDFDSKVEVGRKLVVAGNPAASYLMVMIGAIDPADADPPTVAPPTTIGLMPQNTGGVLMCKQKRDAIDRWITAGAANN